MKKKKVKIKKLKVHLRQIFNDPKKKKNPGPELSKTTWSSLLGSDSRYIMPPCLCSCGVVMDCARPRPIWLTMG